MGKHYRGLLVVAGIAAAALTFGSPARAAGALAVGDCGAYGWVYGANSPGEAGQTALQQCRSHGGHNCQVKEYIEGACAALATDESQSCGAMGWGRAPSRNQAEEVALQYCQQYGGNNCTIRRWVCD